MRNRQRRRLLTAVLSGGGAALLGLGPRRGGLQAFAQTSHPPPSATDLRGGLVQLSGAGGNIVVLETTSGVAMVDSGAPQFGGVVSNLVSERFGGAPVEILFNTHWHLEHTGGNEAVGQGRARILAHENTRLWMSTEFYVDWEDRTYAPRLPAARPTDTFYSSDPQPIEVDYAGTRIEYGLLREAHTDGDLYIHFADHNVIVAGGAFTVGRYPLLDYATGGLIGGLINATESLIDLSDSETLVVPADGPAQNRNALEAQRDMLQTVRERVQALARQGKSVEEMLAAGITDEFEMRWGGNTRQFVANIYSSLWGLGR